MAFDAELRETTQSIAFMMATSRKAPSLELAQTDPARVLAMLYCEPQPCEALDRLLTA